MAMPHISTDDLFIWSLITFKACWGLADPSRLSILCKFEQSLLLRCTGGVLQGDSLFPLLFIIILESLLRWLHSGSRGYIFGTDFRWIH